MYAPCKGCEDREIGCHSHCDRYAEFRKVVDEKREMIKELKKVDEFAAVSSIRHCKRIGLTARNSGY